MIHTGRELGLIEKHVRNRNEYASEYVYWYQFRPFPVSTYDDVYDEGTPGTLGRKYLNPIRVTAILFEEMEDLFTPREDGRKPTQNVGFTILLRDAVSAGIKAPGEYNSHLNDLLQYDNRYYKVAGYQVRGRLHGEVLIKIQGFEVFIEEEFVFDAPLNSSSNDLWPNTFPT